MSSSVHKTRSLRRLKRWSPRAKGSNPSASGPQEAQIDAPRGPSPHPNARAAGGRRPGPSIRALKMKAVRGKGGGGALGENAIRGNTQFWALI